MLQLTQGLLHEENCPFKHTLSLIPILIYPCT